MGFKDKQNWFGQRKILLYFALAFLPIALYRLCFNYPLSAIDETPQDSLHLLITTKSSSSQEKENQDRVKEEEALCNYTEGKWVPDKIGPLYNGTTCGTIKEGQNCFRHGRPDSGYLYWKWKPNKCEIPRFNSTKFLDLMRNKHLAFIGDSMARNQLESLLCLLSTVYTPNLIYKNGEDNKFRKWRFESYNVTISVYWSPFLVAGMEKSSETGGLDHNVLYLDRIDEKWGNDLQQIDTIVLSIGHWFLHPAWYYEYGSILGCHSCETSNCTEIGFYDVFRKAIRTTLKAVINENHPNREVILATFSPSHFEGRAWDSLGACNMTEPYERKEIEGMDGEMRRIEMEEVVAAAETAAMERRLTALDVTGLSLLRGDGHPGPYMYAFPFAKGVPEKVHNDCLHWCLPGPVDTWNEIMLEVLWRWRGLN